jgi:hypothetical protein
VAGGSFGHVTGFSGLLRENRGCNPRHLAGLKRMAYLVSLLAPDAGLFRAIAQRFRAGSLRGGLPASGMHPVEMIG